MKKTLLVAFAGFLTTFGFAQTAVNFTLNDCASSSHTLFTELNAGKVIVLTWVMPCGQCIGIASTAATTAQGYASSNPGRVKFYLVDGNNMCSTLASWASTNSITPDAVFSNSAIKMTDYGSSGMQKTVVMGGPDHTVYYNQVGNISASAIQTAINNALAATTGIAENKISNFGLNVFPNPSASNSKVSYTLTTPATVSIDILNLLGEKVNTISLGTQSAGKQEAQINVESLSKGIYLIRLNAGEATETVQISVTR